MKRREFLGLGVSSSAGLVLASQVVFADDKAKKAAAPAAGASSLAEKDILREGQPATIANYCEKPEAKPNKYCPSWPGGDARCKSCMFYNKDNSEAAFKGIKYARCQLLSDPKKAQYVSENAYCATYVKKT